MKKQNYLLFFFILMMITSILASSCKSEDDFIKSPANGDVIKRDTIRRDTLQSDTAKHDSATKDTIAADTAKAENALAKYDRIPAEHDITYSVLEQNSYSSIGYFTHYMAQAQIAGDGAFSSFTSMDNETMKKVFSTLLSTARSLSTKVMGRYYTAKIKYTSTDINGQPIKVSALLAWHNSGKIDKVVYANHGTRIGDIDSPSDGFSPEIFFATSGALIIMPDYIGAGLADYVPEPYLVAQNGGDVAVDGYLAGIKFAKERIKNFSPDFKGYIAGYSQGGAVSLAALRSLQQRSAERQKMLNVKRVICGDGPYDLEATFKDYLSQKSMFLPIVLPLAIHGMYAGYPDVVKDINFSSCFTDEANATGVPSLIYIGEGTTMELMSFFIEGAPASKILSKDLMSMSGKKYETLFGLLKRQNLCTGWKPQYPLLFIHDKGDTVVPYINMEHAYEGLKNEYVETPVTLDEGMDHGGGMIYFMTKCMTGEFFK